MKEIQFSIEINISKERVWSTLWEDVTFRDWVNIIDEGTSNRLSYIVVPHRFRYLMKVILHRLPEMKKKIDIASAFYIMEGLVIEAG